MRAFDFDYQVDGKPLLVPDAAVELRFSDLISGDSGADEAGFYHRMVLRRGLRQWDFSYKVLTGQELRYLLELVGGDFQFSFRGLDGQPERCRCHCDSLDTELYDREQDIYKNLHFAVKEC